MGEQDDVEPQPVDEPTSPGPPGRNGYKTAFWSIITVIVLAAAGIGGYIVWDKNAHKTSKSALTPAASATPTDAYDTVALPELASLGKECSASRYGDKIVGAFGCKHDDDGNYTWVPVEQMPPDAQTWSDTTTVTETAPPAPTTTRPPVTRTVPRTTTTTNPPSGPTVTYRAWSNVAQTESLSYSLADDYKYLGGFVFQKTTTDGTNQYTWGYKFTSTRGQDLEVNISGPDQRGAWVACEIQVNGTVVARDRSTASDGIGGTALCST